MAQDDYDYIVFKILTYLYTCFKRQNSFDKDAFKSQIITAKVSEEYMTDILRLTQDEGYIEGLAFKRAWGNEYILINDLENLRITSLGIRYLLDNEKMNKIKNAIIEGAPGIIFELVKMAFFTQTY